jgi:hypothetical protein
LCRTFVVESSSAGTPAHLHVFAAAHSAILKEAKDKSDLKESVWLYLLAIKLLCSSKNHLSDVIQTFSVPLMSWMHFSNNRKLTVFAGILTPTKTWTHRFLTVGLDNSKNVKYNLKSKKQESKSSEVTREMYLPIAKVSVANKTLTKLSWKSSSTS